MIPRDSGPQELVRGFCFCLVSFGGQNAIFCSSHIISAITWLTLIPAAEFKHIPFYLEFHSFNMYHYLKGQARERSLDINETYVTNT